jgi:hypothetical protein
MFSSTIVSDKVNLSSDGAVGGGSGISARSEQPIKLESLSEKELSAVCDVMDAAADPYVKWEDSIQILGGRYAHTEQAGMVAQVIRRISEVGLENAFPGDEEVTRDAQELPSKVLAKAAAELAGAALVLDTSLNPNGEKRAELLTDLIEQLMKTGPYKAFDAVGVHVSHPFTTGSLEGLGMYHVTAYIASMFCENPAEALEFILNGTRGKIDHHMQVHMLRKSVEAQFRKNKGVFISQETLDRLVLGASKFSTEIE